MYLVNLPQVSNAADWIETMQLTSEDDGQPIDLTGCTITLQVVTQTFRGPGSVQAGWPNINSSYGTPVLTASTTNGKLTVPAPGVIQWTFRASELAALMAGFYEVGMVVTDGTNTTQLLIGSLPVINGAVAA